MNNNLISQAGQMRLSHLPNDIIPTFAAIFCIVLAPVIQAATNFLARRGIVLSAALRITVSFGLCGVAIGYACLTQHLIYTAPPCFDRPGHCDSSTGPNHISVFVQIPTYVIVAVAEVVGFVTASEYAYSHSPKEAKSIIQALSQLAAAMGSALGLATSPAAKDPYLVTYYASLAGVMVVSAGLFWWAFRKRATTGSDDEE
jgi:POT family proton-dependent oligopeptide transporter